MIRSRAIAWVCGLLILPAAVWAAPDDEPGREESQPEAPQRPPRPMDREGRGPGDRPPRPYDPEMGPDGPGPGGGRREREIEQRMQERRADMMLMNEMFAFMAEHSPRRLEMYRSLPEGPRKQRIRDVLRTKYMMLRQVREQGDDALYEVLLARSTAEDAAWGKAFDLRMAKEEERPKIREELRAAIVQLVEIGLKERTIRLERLEKAVAREKSRLQADLESPDRLIDDTYAKYESGQEGLNPDHPPGPRDRPPGPPPHGGGPPRERMRDEEPPR